MDELQRVIVTSEFCISFWPYHASPKDKEETQKQVQEILEGKLIKEPCISLTFSITLAYKKREDKTQLCIDCRKVML